MITFTAIDLESHLIRDGQGAPRMVCLSWADKHAQGLLGGDEEGRRAALDHFRKLLHDPRQVLVGANIWYDLGVLCAEDPSLIPAVFAAFEADRIRDVQLRQKMRDLRDGLMKFQYDDEGNATKSTYSLADLEIRLLGRDRSEQKHAPDAWRLRYGELDGVPVADWPTEAKDYPIADVVGTLEIHALQGDPIADELRQTRYQWALQLMSLWGVRTDPAAVAALKVVLEAEADEGRKALLESGLMRMTKKKGQLVPSKHMEVIYQRLREGYANQGLEPPLTPTGRPQATEEALKDSGDPSLAVLAEVGSTFKLLSKDIPQLERGAIVPLCPRWNGLVETGRTSVSPNVQNPPRKGGIRECHIPRPGWVYVSTDLDTIELRALAQACLKLIGWSTMADALRRGEDLHTALAADLMGIEYSDCAARIAAGDKDAGEMRQFAKIPNFGLPGGMGPDSLVAWARGQLPPHLAERVDLKFAKRLIDAWHRKWPEMREYFRMINTLVGAAGQGTIVQLYSGRERGGVPFCAACNTFFQGLTADAAKSALYRICRACYLGDSGDGTGAPLLGSRPVLFIHDEVITEVPWDPAAPERAHAAAQEQARILVHEVQRWIPDIPISSTAVMMRRWFKGAKPVTVDYSGAAILVPGRPEEKAGRTVWVPDGVDAPARVAA